MGQQVEKEPRLKQEDTEEVPKKTYASPKLTEYGNISKLTKGSAGTAADGGSGMFRPCL